MYLDMLGLPDDVEFILVDGIMEFKKGESIVAVKNVPLPMGFLLNHPSHGMIIPPTLIIESLVQAGGWLITAFLDFKKRALLVGMGSVKSNGFVRPNDELTLEAELELLHKDSAILNAGAKFGSEVIVELNYVLASFVDANQLEDPEETKRRFFNLLKNEKCH